MLKGISPLISPELLKVLAEMGPGDEIIFANVHFPGSSLGPKVVRADGVRIAPLLDAVLPVFELDTSAENSCVVMAAGTGGALDQELVTEYAEVIARHNNAVLPILYVEYPEFYERAKKAYAVVMTGEKSQYGNIILRKGITPGA